MFDWASRWFTADKLREDQLRRLAALPLAGSADRRRLDAARLVVVDVETTGLSLQRDQMIAIGAVAVHGGCIDLRDQFEATLRRPGLPAKESVLLHGISPGDLASGVEPREAMICFLEYVRESPLFAFHAAFDRHMLMKTLKAELNQTQPLLMWDVADVARYASPEAQGVQNGLDDWLARFGLRASARHNAGADAFATAELLLVLLNRLAAKQVETLAELDEKLKLAKRLQLHRI